MSAISAPFYAIEICKVLSYSDLGKARIDRTRFGGAALRIEFAVDLLPLLATAVEMTCPLRPLHGCRAGGASNRARLIARRCGLQADWGLNQTVETASFQRVEWKIDLAFGAGRAVKYTDRTTLWRDCAHEPLH